MVHRSDYKNLFLVGSSYTGSNEDMERAYLVALGSTAGPINDMWHEYWDGLTIADGAFGDRAELFLIAQGIAEGQIGDMWWAWWKAKYEALP